MFDSLCFEGERLSGSLISGAAIETDSPASGRPIWRCRSSSESLKQNPLAPALEASWLQGHRQMRRGFGPDLMLEICRRSAARGYTQFLYGGKPGVVEQLRVVLSERFPGMNLVGTYVPPFRDLTGAEEADLIGQVAETKPDIIWVGLSTPRQERFMAEYVDRLECKLMVGVGAAFDMHTGRIKDAPRWVKQAGLQWAHRLYQEPSRLWKRYLVNNSEFVVKLALQVFGLTRYEANG